jgi:hypothetical protein
LTLDAETGRLVPFGEDLRTLVKNSKRVKNRISIPWAAQQRICRAIVLIHNQARYFEGMAILCGLAGWKPRCLENEFDPPEEQLKTRAQFNKWVRELAGANRSALHDRP